MDTDKITESIIGYAIAASNALVLELQKTELKVEQQKKIQVKRVGLILNFGTPKLGIKRMVL